MPRAALRLLPVLGIWAAAATVLAIPVRRVVDWFVMTDELLYERLAFSVARTGSPLPALHGRHVPVANQLYPLLLSTVAGGDYVPSFLVRAHTLNAIVMTSAAVPAYLLARDLLRSRLAAYAASALAVLVPWLVLASFLLTEVAAYPAFLWGVYLLQRAIARPSRAADALAIAGLALALLARTQFFVLVVVAPLAVLAQERDPRRAVARHRVLAGAAVAGVLVLIVLAAAGRLSSVLGTYSATAHGSLVGSSTPRSFLEHAATLSLGLGLLPALLGAAWLSARAVKREAGPTVAILALVLIVLEVTSFDLRYGGDLPRDRYLFYGAPLLLTGFLGALEDVRLPRWSLAAPLAIVVLGLLVSPLPTFEKLNVDMPAAILDDYLRRSGGGLGGARGLLVACSLLLVVIFVVARLVAPLAVVAVLLVAATAVALTAETAYAFDRLFRVDGTSGRPVTLSQGGVFDWIDRTVGPDENVTIIPYAQIMGDYWATAAYWWDLEFWNRSVTRAAYPQNRFAEIQSTFPKIFLTFDPATGRASASPTRYAAESDYESRFRLRGPTLTVTRDVRLIDAGRSWQADWASFGLDDDGFTLPNRTATIRVYPAPGQTRPLRRYVSVELAAHNVVQRATFETNEGTWPSTESPQTHGGAAVQVCVPPRGFGSIRLRTLDPTQVYGDFGTRAGTSETRVRGVQVFRVSLADETAPC